MNITLQELLEEYKLDTNKFNQKYNSNDFQILHRVNIQPLENFEYDNKLFIKAIFLDVETTGLKSEEDEVIEIAIIPFVYNKNTSEILAILKPFNELQEPSIPISPEITKLTGITNEMVKGHHINKDKLENIIKDANLIIAHNANFDRPFTEKLSTIFSKKIWACSVEDIDWSLANFENKILGYLCMQAGFFYEKHRAIEDCYAALQLLKTIKFMDNTTAFSHLLTSARKNRYRLWACHSNYNQKDILKERGYRWNDSKRTWYIDIIEDALETEESFLTKEIYNHNPSYKKAKINFIDRFSNRITF